MEQKRVNNKCQEIQVRYCHTSYKATFSTLEDFENGIYHYTNTSTLTRASDADTAAELTAGTFFFVQSGTLAGDNGFVQTEIVNSVGSGNNIKYTQFSGAGQIVAGAAITKTGNQLDIGVDGSSIEVTADALNELYGDPQVTIVFNEQNHFDYSVI